MESSESQLTPNILAFIALSNEYCAAMENAASSTPAEFAQTMLRLLPRIYISASDIPNAGFGDNDFIEPSMDEDMYNAVNSTVAALFGEHDTYLEVFEEDMKFSDTPIAASIAEGLTDIMQVLYNFVETVRNAPNALIERAIDTIAEDFRNYWSRILCNQLRAINALVHSGVLDQENY